jgi:GntR family transcriptional regulator
MQERVRAEGGPREVPPSRRIADELRREILAGELAPGAPLPSERVLARTHGTARNTARQAIAMLQAEGLVSAEHGRGVFVRQRRPFLRVAHDRYARRYREAGRAPFRAEAEAQGWTPRVEVTAIEPTLAPTWVAERLSLTPSERVLLRRNRYLAGTPLEREVPAPGGIYAALEALGHRLARIDELATARMPLPEEAAALALSPGVPVIDLRHTSYDQRDEPIEVTHSILSADRNALTIHLPVD